MPEANRDLLVLSKLAELSAEAMKREVAQLNTLLFHAENWDSFCKANEIIDVNRHKIIRKPFIIQKLLGEKKIKPFVFICNKN
jgi:hypothetical protein